MHQNLFTFALLTASLTATFAHADPLSSNNGSAYGVYSNGNMGAGGVKSFRIDHPDDPANKYLLRYSTESPEVLNAYSGTIALDGAGESVVELPHYFAKINKGVQQET